MWTIFTKKGKFSNLHTLRRFITAATVDSPANVITAFDSKPASFELLLEAIQANESAFINLAVPFMTMFSSFASSLHRIQLKKLYTTMISYPDPCCFIDFALDATLGLVRSRDVSVFKRLAEKEVQSAVTGWQQVFAAVFSLMSRLVTTLDGARTHPNIDSWMHKLTELMQLASTFPDVQDRTLNDWLQRITKSVPPREQLRPPSSTSSSSSSAASSSSSSSSSRFVPRFKRDTEGPGEHRPDGPRHDNDFEDFTDVSVVPCQMELSCTIPNYLPLPEGDKFLAPGEHGYLDRLFRLLREEMLSPLQDGVQFFFSRFDPKKIPAVPYSQRDQRVQLYCFPNCYLERPDPTFDYPVRLVFSFPQPWLSPDLIAASKTKKLDFTKGKVRKEFWEGPNSQRFFQEGSLVVIINPSDYVGADATKRIFRPMMLGVVAKRLTTELAGPDGERGEIALDVSQLLTNRDGTLLPSNLKPSSALKGRPRQPLLLLQVAKHFFRGYQPILTSLQEKASCPLPFSQLLVGDATQSGRPTYYNSLNLQSLLKPDAPPCPALKSVLATTSEGLMATLGPLLRRNWLRVDESQCEALVYALCNSVAVINGPPGTGKSYIGIQLVKVLLKNAKKFALPPRFAALRGVNLQQVAALSAAKMTPIVCLCYTNHALDQFLEGIIDSKVTKSIVRIGSRTKSERIAECNLHKLTQLVGSDRSVGRAMWNAREKMEKAETKIDQIWNEIERLASASSSQQLIGALQNFWREYQPDLTNFLTTGEDADGFKTQGKPAAKWLSEKSLAILKKLFTRGDDVANPEFSKTMSHRERAELVYNDFNDYMDSLLSELDEKMKQYSQLAKEFSGLRDVKKLNVLQGADIIGMTTTGAAMHQELLQALSPGILIVEEAGEVFESHIVSALSERCQHLIMIGDHLQLRPKANVFDLTRDSGRGYDLDVSLFERLVSNKKYDFRMLREQRRMHPEISNLIRAYLYPSLLDFPSVNSHPPVRGMLHRLWFFDVVDCREQTGNAGSYANKREAQLVACLVRHLVKQGYQPEQLAVITPYAGQLLEIRDQLSRQQVELVLDEQSQAEIDGVCLEAEDLEEALNDEANPGAEASSSSNATRVRRTLRSSVRLSTVDNFQGEEADVVILSTVRNNTQGKVGFLKTDNRVNVMLSRARHGMYILGSESTVKAAQRKEKGSLFGHCLAQLEERERIGTYFPLKCQTHEKTIKVSTPDDFSKHAPDGGCSLPCESRLPCGHICTRSCHADDRDHKLPRCLESCLRPRSCGHPCVNPCYENCGQCFMKMHTALPLCGHVHHIDCQIATSPSKLAAYKCHESIIAPLPICGHSVTLPCWKYCKIMQALKQGNWSVLGELLAQTCQDKCNGHQTCNHPCEAKCGQCVNADWMAGGTIDRRMMHLPCSSVCNRDFFCGHRCQQVCHLSSNDCGVCTQPCLVRCQHSACPLKCNEMCSPCAEPCLWSCSHDRGQCRLPCGVPCIRLPCDQRCSHELPCGHRCPLVCGEACPVDKCDVVCRECARISGKAQSDLVDLIMCTSLVDHDPDESPLVLLDCGHALTIESADGVFKLDQAYSREEGGWSRWLPLSSDLKPQEFRCPFCRQAVSCVARYGRITKMLFSQQTAKRHSVSCSDQIGKQRAEVAEIRKALFEREDAQQVKARLRAVKTVVDGFHASVVKRVHDLVQAWRNIEAAKRGVGPLASSSSSQKADESAFGSELRQPWIASAKCLTAELQLLQLAADLKWPPVPARRAEQNQAVTHVQLPSLDERLAKKADDILVAVRCFQEAEQEAELQRLVATRGTISIAFVLAASTLLSVLQSAGHTDIDQLRQLRQQCRLVLDRLAAAPFTDQAQLAHARRVFREAASGRLDPKTLKEIFAAMSKEVGENNGTHGTYGGHWFTCPNGHIYAIGECGGAMQSSRCPECGALIGGGDHQLAGGNARATDFLRIVGDPAVLQNTHQESQGPPREAEACFIA